MKSTSGSYRSAALDHLNVAQLLHKENNFVLANCVAGLAVECILRAYAVRNDPECWKKAHHDLRIWYKDANFDAVVPDAKTKDISAARGMLQTHWRNGQRYSSLELLRSEFKSKQLDRGIKGDFLKELTSHTVNAAFEIVTIGVRQWTNSSRRSSIS